MKALDPLDVAGLTERHPNTPGEWLTLSVDRELDAPLDEVRLSVNDAVVRAKPTARSSLFAWYGVVAQRSTSAEGRHPEVEFTAR